jgi:carboxyl-terminal processing protease
MKPASLSLMFFIGVLSAVVAAPPGDSDGKKSGKDAPKPVAGIGLVVAMLGENLTVMKVLPGTPAADASLTERLVILTIDGVPTAGKSQEACGAMLRGLPGTRVQLGLIDVSQGKRITVELTRRWVR